MSDDLLIFKKKGQHNAAADPGKQADRGMSLLSLVSRVQSDNPVIVF